MIAVNEFARPRTVDEALNIMSSGDYTPIAGGTDVIPQLRRGEPKKLIDVASIGLDFIKINGDSIEVGAAVTHNSLATNSIIINNLPLLSIAASMVGSQQIRNRGTIGGNIVNASPCADTAPALLIYDAELILISKGAKRSVKLADFITMPYMTVIQPNELLHSITCKTKPDKNGISYIKLGRRQAVNISRMTLAVSLAKDKENIIKSAQISAGSVFPVPSRINEIERILRGQSGSPKLFEEVSNLAADLMIKDSGYRWSTPYKKPVLIGLMQRALDEAFNYDGYTN